MNTKLWYDEPAGTDWYRALPIGNGRLGAMVFGNVDSVWNGGPRDRNNPSARGALPEIRAHLREDRLQEAHDLVRDGLAGIPDSMRFYEPLADVLIRHIYPQIESVGPENVAAHRLELAAEENSSRHRDYYRELDLQTATSQVRYAAGGISYRRYHIASAPDDVIAIRYESDAPGALNLRLRLERGPRSSYSTRYLDTIEALGSGGLLGRGKAGAKAPFRLRSPFKVPSRDGLAGRA
jgi:alpha-L-fucosidase 2